MQTGHEKRRQMVWNSSRVQHNHDEHWRSYAEMDCWQIHFDGELFLIILLLMAFFVMYM